MQDPASTFFFCALMLSNIYVWTNNLVAATAFIN